MSLPFSRVYIDLPSETHAKLKEHAKANGKPMKVLLAELIERECSVGGSDSKRKQRRKVK